LYAVVGIWTVVEDQRAEAERELREDVIPMIRAHPGFVSGYWMADPETGKWHSTVVFDSEARARQFSELIESQLRRAAYQGATSDILSLVEVLIAAVHEIDTPPAPHAAIATEPPQAPAQSAPH
jgi:hypothetical protein